MKVVPLARILCGGLTIRGSLPSGSVSKESLMIASDEIVRVEEFKIERFMALGLGRYEAIRAVEDGIDWHTIEALVKTGYPLTVAVEA
jgi:hypothetical protein